MLDTIYTWVGSAVIVLICGAALWKGDRLEQWGGGLCFLAWLGSLLIQDDAGLDLQEYAMLGVDFAMLVALGVHPLDTAARPRWPLDPEAEAVRGAGVKA